MFSLAIYQAAQVEDFKVVEPIPPKERTLYNGERHSSKMVWGIVLITLFMAGLIIAQQRAVYAMYIQSVFPQYGAHSIGLLYALNSVMIILLQTPLVDGIKGYNKLCILGGGAFLMGLGSEILSMMTHFTLAILSMMIYTIGEMLFFSVAQYLSHASSDARKPGILLGAFQTTYAASIVTGPLVGTYIYHRLPPVSVWYGCGLVGTLAFCLCFFRREQAVRY